MKQVWKYVAALLVVVVMLGAASAPAMAGEMPPPPTDGKCEFFHLGAVHSINGERLGLPMALPVDVYVNGGYAFTFEFKDTVGPVMLPAGRYTVTVNLAGTDTQVMSLGPVDIPGCVKVVVVAKLINGVPTLVPKITQLSWPVK
jgi:hypothetical protein